MTEKTFEQAEISAHVKAVRRARGTGNPELIPVTYSNTCQRCNSFNSSNSIICYTCQNELKSGIAKEQQPKERTFESGSKRDDDSSKPLTNHLLGYTRIRFGFRLRSGANKYGKGNWRLGQPEETIEESTDRHWAQWLDGDRTEDHLAAVMFGLNQLFLKDKEAGIPADHYFKPLT